MQLLHWFSLSSLLIAGMNIDVAIDLPSVELHSDAIESISNEMDETSLTNIYSMASKDSYMLATSTLLRRTFPGNPEYAKQSLESYESARRFGFSLRIYSMLPKLVNYSVILTGFFIWPDAIYDKLSNGVVLAPKCVQKIDQLILHDSPLLRLARKIDDDTSAMRKEMNRMRNLVCTFVLHYLLFSDDDLFCPSMMEEILKYQIILTVQPVKIFGKVEDIQTAFYDLRDLKDLLTHDVYHYLRRQIRNHEITDINMDPRINKFTETMKTLLRS